MSHSALEEPCVASDAETESTSSDDWVPMSKQELTALKMLAATPALALLKEVAHLSEVAADLTCLMLRLTSREEQLKGLYSTTILSNILDIQGRLSELEASFSNDGTRPSNPTSQFMLALQDAENQSVRTQNVVLETATGSQLDPPDIFGGPAIVESDW